MSRTTLGPSLSYMQHLLHIRSHGWLYLEKVSARTQDTNRTWLSARARVESYSSSQPSIFVWLPSLGLRHDPPHAASLFFMVCPRLRPDDRARARPRVRPGIRPRVRHGVRHGVRAGVRPNYFVRNLLC